MYETTNQPFHKSVASHHHFFAAITVSVASSPTFFKIVSKPLAYKLAT
ncbi:hypothetical protein BGP_0688 [Beggiatoa sp. PS]|nr:hypothetical protein BGP_0688 [Beggiatoa sp. PS]